MPKEKTKCEVCGTQSDTLTSFESHGRKTKAVCSDCLKRVLAQMTGATVGGALSVQELPDEIEEPMLAPREIAELAARVRKQHHEQRLLGARIKFVLVPRKVPEDGDKRVELAKAKRVGRVEKLLSNADFVITIGWPVWNTLSATQQAALLDHEFCHCEPKEDRDGNRVGWQIRHHDIEDFSEVLGRHGLWSDSWERVGETLRQLEIFQPAPAEA